MHHFMLILTVISIYSVCDVSGATSPLYLATCTTWTPPVAIKVKQSYIDTTGWGRTEVCDWYSYWRSDMTSYTEPIPIVNIRLEDHPFPELANLTFFNESLKFIYLSNNDISSVSCELLEGLGQLLILSVESNQLTEIPGSCPGGPALPLTTLVLDGNNITTMTATSFEGFDSLEIVSLASNQHLAGEVNNIINRLPASIQDIDLKAMSLTDADISALSTALLPNLTKLNLQANLLTNFPNIRSESVATLQYLELFDNRIQETPMYYLDNFPSLEYLRLAENPLHTLTPALTPNTTNLNLQTLKLNRNDLTALSAEYFRGMTNLNELTLSNNDFRSIGNLSSYFNSLNLVMQSVSLVCDEMLAWTKDGSFTGSITVGTAPCAEPPELVGVDWADITFEIMMAFTTPQTTTTETTTQTIAPETTTTLETTTQTIIQETTSQTTLPATTTQTTLPETTTQTTIPETTTTLETNTRTTNQETDTVQTIPTQYVTSSQSGTTSTAEDTSVAEETTTHQLAPTTLYTSASSAEMTEAITSTSAKDELSESSTSVEGTSFISTLPDTLPSTSTGHTTDQLDQSTSAYPTHRQSTIINIDQTSEPLSDADESPTSIGDLSTTILSTIEESPAVSISSSSTSDITTSAQEDTTVASTTTTTETMMERRNYTKRNNLVSKEMAAINSQSPSGDVLKALKLYYETPVEAPQAVFIGTAAIVFLCIEVALVFIVDLPHLFHAVRRYRDMVRECVQYRQ